MKSLEFWRYGQTHNSHKYRNKPKVRQHLKTVRKRLENRVKELGFNPNIWTAEELLNINSKLDDDIWYEIGKDEAVSKYLSILKNGLRFGNKESFHAPPVSRGLYVFPAGFVEWFLVGWKEDSKLRKTEIKFSGPTLWCHHEEEAIKLGIQILEKSKHWILVKSEDYSRLLKAYINSNLNYLRETGRPYVKTKSLHLYVELYEAEVFLVL